MPKRKKRQPKKDYTKNSAQIRFSESYISLILGFLVVIVAAMFVFTFSKNRTFDRINTAVSTYQQLTAPQNENQRPKTYTVKEGDDLWSIAEKVYGSGYNWVDLARTNNLQNPGLITAGQNLIVPDVPKITVVNVEQVQNNGSSIIGSTYTVQKGDFLWGIAIRAYGDGYKWLEIAKVNNLQNPDLIFAGDVIKLPR